MARKLGNKGTRESMNDGAGDRENEGTENQRIKGSGKLEN